MIQTRLLGKLLRGKATTFQIGSACVLGGLIGAQPGFMEAPGIVTLLGACLLILNANLFFAGLVAGVTKLASLALIAVQFEIGMILIDGPLQPLAKAAINAPVLAWFGVDNYVAVGGLAVGAVIGIVAAVALVKTIAGFRKKMADLEENSDRYKKWSSQGWVKLLSWLLIGGNKGKKSYEELVENKGLPIRIPGVIVATLLVGVVAALPFVLTDGVVTSVVRSELGKANGATVDLESASVDLQTGKATLVGLQIADRANLDRNLVQAQAIDADFSTGDLLRKRYTFDQVVASEVKRDTTRATRAELIGDPDRSDTPPSDEDSGPLEDYIEKAEEWKERLDQIKDWLEQQTRSSDEDSDGSGSDPGTNPDGSPADPTAPQESLKDRLRRLARESGYASVTADHLVDDHPRALIRELRVEGIESETDPRVYDLVGTNVSTDPSKVEEPGVIHVTSRDDVVDVTLSVPGSQGGVPTLAATLTDLPADDLAAELQTGDEPPFLGGTVDIALNAELPSAMIDAPIVATLHNTTLNVLDLGPQSIGKIQLPVHLSGPIDNPSIRVERGEIIEALKEAGKSEAAAKLTAEAEKRLNDAAAKVGIDVPDDLADKAKKGISSLFGKPDKDEDDDGP
ncbi:MAG: hypothetical protein AAGI53_07745 [Planctomycetota bacterium]